MMSQYSHNSYASVAAFPSSESASVHQDRSCSDMTTVTYPSMDAYGSDVSSHYSMYQSVSTQQMKSVSPLEVYPNEATTAMPMAGKSSGKVKMSPGQDDDECPLDNPAIADMCTVVYDPTTIASLQGSIAHAVQEQMGSQFVRVALQNKDAHDVSLIFQEIRPHAGILMCDTFGSLVVQQLFDVLETSERILIWQEIAGDLPSIAMHMHGTRTLQKIVDLVDTPEEAEALQLGLKGNIAPLVRDPNGTHVIQRCLSRLSYPSNQFIYDELTHQTSIVATNRQGCCIIQRALDAASDTQKHGLVTEIIRKTVQLVQDPFGNYVIQYVLDMNKHYVNVNIIRQLLPSVPDLACNKFSSNVVEKCLKLATPDLQQLILDELCNPAVVPQLLQDSYANYVLQTALNLANPDQHAQLCSATQPFMHLIRNSPYGKKLEVRLTRRRKQGRSSRNNSMSAIPREITPFPTAPGGALVESKTHSPSQ